MVRTFILGVVVRTTTENTAQIVCRRAEPHLSHHWTDERGRRCILGGIGEGGRPAFAFWVICLLGWVRWP